MNPIRNLVNCFLGGLAATLLLTETLLLLNPSAVLTARMLAGLFWVFVLTYGLAVCFGYWILLRIVEVFRGRPLRPAWLSFRVLTWLFMLDLALGAALLWHNLFTYRLYLPPESIRALAAAAATVSAGAAILLVIGLFHYSFGRRGAILSYGLFTLALTSSLLLPLYFRPRAAEEKRGKPQLALEHRPMPRRLTILGIEGASLSYVLPAIAEGRLPNFARLISGGASGPLKTLYPTESFAVWTTVATGKLPHQHGLKGFYRYRFKGTPELYTLLPRGPYFIGLLKLGLMQQTVMTTKERQSLSFWNILSRVGVKLGLVRWWASYPAEELNGFIVSDMFHRQIRERFSPPLPRTTYPPELFDELQSLVVDPKTIDNTQLERFLDAGVAVPDDRVDWEFELKQRALADDTTYDRVGRSLRSTYDPEVYAIYFFGLDVVGHYFLRYALPDRFGDVSEAEISKYGRVLDAYYRHMDATIGEYLAAKREDEILIVLSGHGMEPLPLHERAIEAFKGNTTLSGYHADAPDGLVIVYGPGVAKGVKVQGASVLDVTPTLLYLMGLPLGQDMKGSLLSEVFEHDVLRSEPVTYISSYQNFVIEPWTADSWELPFPLDIVPGVQDERQ